MSTPQSNIVKSFSSVSVDSVAPHTVNEKKAKLNILNAQLRQTVKTIYPKVQIKNGGIFDATEFEGIEGQEYTSERVTWIDVPANTTAEGLQERMNNFPEARIWAIYSNQVEDVLNAGQKQAIQSGQQTLDFFENKLRIRGEGGVELDGPRQYRNYEFSSTPKEDVDLRTVKNSNSTMKLEEVDVNNGQSVL